MKGFKTNDVIIRRFKMTDVEQVYTDVLMLNNQTSKTINETQKIVQSAISEYYTEEPIWAVEERKTGKLIGSIKVVSYSSKNKLCEISWEITQNCSNVNLMQQALNKVMNYLFLKKNVELIVCSYYEQNTLTGEILDSLGMKKEAVLRNRRFNAQTNQKENFVIYSIDIDEFSKVSI